MLAVAMLAVIGLVVGGGLYVQGRNATPDIPAKRASDRPSAGFNLAVANELAEPVDVVVDGRTVGTLAPGEQTAADPDVPKRPGWKVELRSAAGVVWADDVAAGMYLAVRVTPAGVHVTGRPGGDEEEEDEYE